MAHVAGETVRPRFGLEQTGIDAGGTPQVDAFQLIRGFVDDPHRADLPPHRFGHAAQDPRRRVLDRRRLGERFHDRVLRAQVVFGPPLLGQVAIDVVGAGGRAVAERRDRQFDIDECAVLPAASRDRL
jgi:hypothetical protein